MASNVHRIAAMEVQLAQSHRHPAYFHGQTMRPLLVEGDLVQTEPISWRDVRRGDVVTYRSADKFPTRRVVHIDRGRRSFIIMGDSIPGRREYVVPFDDVLARVVRRQRDGAWLHTTSMRWWMQTRRVLVADTIRRAAWLAPVRWLWRTVRHRRA